MGENRIELIAGPAGWVEASIRPVASPTLEPPQTVWVRLSQADEGRWELRGDLYVPGLTPENLRAIPLRRILLAVGASEGLRADLAARLSEPVENPGTKEFLESFEGWMHDEPSSEPPPLELKRPAGRNLDDAFYGRVAATYRSAVQQGLRPRPAISRAAGVSGDVAGRWIREARRREYLPPTKPGRVTA